MPPRLPSQQAMEMVRPQQGGGPYTPISGPVNNSGRPGMRQSYSSLTQRSDMEATPRNSISSIGKTPLRSPAMEEKDGFYASQSMLGGETGPGQSESGSSIYGGAGHYTEVYDSPDPSSPATRYDKSRQKGGQDEWERVDDKASLIQRAKQRKAAMQEEMNTPEGLQSWKRTLASVGLLSGTFDEHGDDDDCYNGPGNGAGTKRKSKGNKGWLGSDAISACVVRKALHTLPVLVLLWIPGMVAIFGYSASPKNDFAQPTLLGTGTFWWSIWLSSVWASIWIMGLLAHWVPRLLRYTTSDVSSVLDRQIYYLIATETYVTFFLWSFFAWVSYFLIVWAHNPASGQADSLDPFLTPSNSTSTTTSSSTGTFFLHRRDSSSSNTANYSSGTQESILFGRFLLGIFICSIILLAEKLAIQSIAMGFHEVTYQDRINLAEFHVKVVTTLYVHSRKDINKLRSEMAAAASPPTASEAIKAKQKRRVQAQPPRKTDSVLSIASRDLIGPALLAPTSPKAIVTAALERAEETRKLARRVFFSYSKPLPGASPFAGSGEGDQKISSGRTAGDKDEEKDDGEEQTERVLRLDDIAQLFPNRRYAQAAFSCLDKDDNGDCTLEEVEAGFEEMHRERVSLLESMQGVDAAVGKLDKIFTSVYTVVACIIVAALLSTHFATFVTSFGTALLGLSWLVASTAQEALSAVVWVFYKHPIDCGDTVDIPDLLPLSYTTQSLSDTSECLFTATYVVQEIKLLSTVLKSSTGKFVQVSNAQLAQKPLVNLRRSGPIEELIRLKVWYRTSLDKIEELRAEMIKWLETQGRDFKPGLDIQIDGPGDQSGMTLVLGIRYKSNWQNSAIKARRRNRWICTLKNLMWTLSIHGVQGDPLQPSPVQLWSRVDEVPEGALDPAPKEREPITKRGQDAAGVKLMDTRKLNENLMDVYGESPSNTWDDVVSPTLSRADAIVTLDEGLARQQRQPQQQQRAQTQAQEQAAASRPRFPISRGAASPTSQYVPLHVQGRRMSGRPDESMA